MANDDQLTILIVDDNRADADYLRQVLQGTFDIKEVNDFKPYPIRELLPKVHLAMVDLYDDATRTPLGLDIIKVIAQSDRHIPVIVMTSPDKVQLEVLAKAIEDGTAQDFLWKHGPAGNVTPSEVILKVNGAIARAKNRAEATLNAARSLRLLLIIIITTTLGAIISKVFGAENVGKGFQLVSLLTAAGGTIGIKKFL